MAKYYVPFVNLNTFIYEPVGIEPNVYLNSESSTYGDIYFLSQESDNYLDTEDLNAPLPPPEVRNAEATLFQNYLGFGNLEEVMGIPAYSSRLSHLIYFKNYTFPHELSSTASYFTALNLKRNGPYGYSTWKQIRVGENPLTRNQRKRNIITAIEGEDNITSYGQVGGPTSNYYDPRIIEVFKEPIFSGREKPLVITFPKGNNIYRATFEMGSQIKYFESERLNEIYSLTNGEEIQTDPRFKQQFLDKTFDLIGGFGVPVLAIEYGHTIFPQKGSLQFDERLRTNFYHPWKDDREQRKAAFYRNGIAIEKEFIYYEENETYVQRSRWPLDPYKDFLFSTDSMQDIYDNEITNTLGSYAGLLQNTNKSLKNLQGKSRNNNFFEFITPLPRLSYNHTITPLTSCVNPHGMDIEGVNNGSLFNDLSINHIPSGEANWDAGEQYGTNPFYDSYSEFVEDIKRVGKDYGFVPEFRSSLFFNELQAKPDNTPKGFLEVLGGKILDTTNEVAQFINTINELGTTEIGHVSASSNDSNFYQVYSHSDFMRNFDVALEVSNRTSKPLYQMSLTCKGIKKFTPYEGFYPAERTVQIANKFRDSIIDNCYYTGSGAGNNVGDILTTDADRYVYFNNIMTPMFSPGIMFNSIKSGLAIDYPIHTSSLTIANGGVNIYNNDYYIQKPFDERIPFEALLEPNIYLANKEIHCSEPHPSGNLSGSATWNGSGDTTEYQLMMHNFLAETANFFLKDSNFSFIASKRSDEVNINLVSGSWYGLDIILYKSQNISSDALPIYDSTPNNKFASLIMSGSGVQETFTMYSRPSAFGPPSRITGSLDEITSSYSDLGYNWSFTPPYYDGVSKATMLYRAEETRNHTISELFNNSVFLENRISGLYNHPQIHNKFRLDEFLDITKSQQGSVLLNKNTDLIKFGFTFGDNYDVLKDSCCHTLSSLNINLGILKDVDLLDDDSSDVVKVAVDISSDKKSQLIIQPKWETPMFNFQSYGDSDTINLPLVGSQSVPRGIWHQYGQIEEDPNKGIFMKIGDPNENTIAIEKIISTYPSVSSIENLAPLLGLSTEPVKLGKTASKKVVREAIVAVPFFEYTTGTKYVEEERKFLKISRDHINAALEGRALPNVNEMVQKMQRFVMPPMFNFLEDETIDPMTMYIFDFKHTFDQEDLAAIWQNLPPKLMTEFKTEEKTISHNLNVDEEIMNLGYATMGENITPDEALKRMKWMVFKVKQKAEQNYYDKIVGETQKLVKTSPYSHNWPYDYFSLVELAKIDAKVDFATPPPSAQITEERISRIEDSIILPGIGKVEAPTPAPPGPAQAISGKDRKNLVGKVVAVPNDKKNVASKKPKQNKVPNGLDRKVKISPKPKTKKKQTITNPIKTTKKGGRR